MNFHRIYEYRFKDVNQADRQKVWQPIASKIYDLMGRPSKILDPAAGRCEFLNALAQTQAPPAERWAVDQEDYFKEFRDPKIQAVFGNVLDVNLNKNYFNGVFVSNFLEHLSSQNQVAGFLEKIHGSLTSQGVVAIMGPNFKYCAKEYFDCADHTLALTHLAVEEHLYGAGFEILRSIPKFLPFSFRGILPPSPLLTGIYLNCPLAWKILGKQFLILARKNH